MPSGLNLKGLVRALQATDKIVTPRMKTWLLQHGDDPIPREIAQRIFDQITTPPRIRTSTFSASSAGRCYRAQELAFLGLPQTPTDSELQAIFNDGKWRHLRWQAQLLMAGIIIDMEEALRWPAMRAVATPDGVGIVPDDHPRQPWRGKEFGVEIKGVSTFQFQQYSTNGPKESHLFQVDRNFLLGGFGLYVVIYEDKTTQRWHEWVLEPDPKRIDAQRQELAELNDAIDNKALHPMLPECVKRVGAFRECPFGGATGPCVKAGTWPRIKP